MKFIWNVGALIAAVIGWQIIFRIGKLVLNFVTLHISDNSHVFAYILFIVELLALSAGAAMFYLTKELMNNRGFQLHPAPIILYAVYVILVFIFQYVSFFNLLGFVWDITITFLVLIGGTIFAVPEFLSLLKKDTAALKEKVNDDSFH